MGRIGKENAFLLYIIFIDKRKPDFWIHGILNLCFQSKTIVLFIFFKNFNDLSLNISVNTKCCMHDALTHTFMQISATHILPLNGFPHFASFGTRSSLHKLGQTDYPGTFLRYARAFARWDTPDFLRHARAFARWDTPAGGLTAHTLEVVELNSLSSLRRVKNWSECDDLSLQQL